MAKRQQQQIRVVGLQYGGHVLGDGVIIVKVSSGVKGHQLQWRLRLGHRSSPGALIMASPDQAGRPAQRPALSAGFTETRRDLLLALPQQGDFGWCQHPGSVQGSELLIE